MNTNIATLREVEYRMNHDTNGNIVMFPIHFKESAKLYSEIDSLDWEIKRLQSRKEELSRAADIAMETEYFQKEHFRKVHEFLSEIYLDDDSEFHNIGKEINLKLNYRNAKPLKDHKGRWFRTIKDACEYNGIDYQTFMNRKRKGLTLKECFYKGRLSKKNRSVIK